MHRGRHRLQEGEFSLQAHFSGCCPLCNNVQPQVWLAPVYPILFSLSFDVARLWASCSKSTDFDGEWRGWAFPLSSVLVDFQAVFKGICENLQGQARGLRLYFVFYVGQEEV